MESVSIKPKRAQLAINTIALGILLGLSLNGPALSIVCAMLLPLFACPLAKHKEEKMAWIAGAGPAVSTLIHTADPLLSLVLLIPGLLPLWITRKLHPKERTGLYGMMLYMSLTALCMAAVLAVVGLRTALPVADTVTSWVAGSDLSGMFLSRLAEARLISVPEGYHPGGLMAHLMEPMLMEQLLLSFRRTVELFVQTQLPMVLTHACMLIGLFTALRVEHLNGVMLVVEIDPRRPGERKTHLTSPPGFRLLAMPPRFRFALLIVMIVCAMLLSHAGLSRTIGLMGSQFVMTCFQLVGAAVMVFVFAKNHPDQIIPIGIAVGLIYALVPTLPLLIGLLDSIVHYRTQKVREDSET